MKFVQPDQLPLTEQDPQPAPPDEEEEEEESKEGWTDQGCCSRTRGLCGLNGSN